MKLKVEQIGNEKEEAVIVAKEKRYEFEQISFLQNYRSIFQNI